MLHTIGGRLGIQGAKPMTSLCLALPVYNESAQLPASVERLIRRSERWPAYDLEIVIANNGSTDDTGLIADELALGFRNVRHIRLNTKGRGHALRQAWLASDAKILSYMDIDLSTDLDFFPQLIEPIATGRADLAVGSRLLKPSWTRRGWRREFISRSYNGILRHVFHPSFSDAQCGFKAISSAAARYLVPIVEDNNWFFDTELLLLAERCGFRVHDLAVKWSDDPDSRVRIIRTAIEDLNGIMRMRRRLKMLARISRSGSA